MIWEIFYIDILATIGLIVKIYQVFKIEKYKKK